MKVCVISFYKLTLLPIYVYRMWLIMLEQYLREIDYTCKG